MSISYFKNIERATLIEDIILPEITTKSVNLSFFEGGGTLILPHNVYTDMIGKFSINILTPTIDDYNQAKDDMKVRPSNLGNRGQLMNMNNYTSSNYISLVIPKYILLQFTERVPKGTIFIAASINESMDIEDYQIIGLYKKVGGINNV